jgi:anti-sigma regulatory factor (Ser/Thr protein kinase)
VTALPETPAAVRASRVVDQDLLLVLENTMDAIEAARLRVVSHLAPSALAPRVINRLEVVLEELISNVVRHGFDERPDHAMLLSVGAGPAGLDITLEDDGRPFNPFERAPPPAFDTLENAPIGGLGLVAVRRFAQATSYEAEPQSLAWEALVRKDSRPVNRVKVTLAASA